MKNILINKIKSGAFLAVLLLLGSCEFLDIVPDNVPTIEYAFSNRTNAERYLYGCYSYRPAIGDAETEPAIVGSDEIWERYAPTAPKGLLDPSRIARGEQNVVAPRLNFWDNTLFKGIRDCNIFLENIDKVQVDMTESYRARYIAEAKFLKAWYHFYLLKAYGPIPIVDVNLPISAGVEDVKVWREPVDDVVEYIVALLQEAISGLPDAAGVITGTEGGRADKLVAYTMIADVRIWAASPLVNGNSDYAGMIDKRGKHLFSTESDPQKWELAVKACEDAINICHEQGKRLWRVIDPITLSVHPIFQQQCTYRNAICERWNSELIWGSTNNNFRNLMSWITPRLVTLQDVGSIGGAQLAPTMKMVERYYSSNGVPINEDKDWVVNNTWYDNRFKVRPESPVGDEIYLVKEDERTVYLHYNREPRFYASIGFDRGIYFGNGYYNFSTDVKYFASRSGDIGGIRVEAGFPVTGYAAKKIHSFKNTQTATASSYEYFPFPIYRLADLYLMYAEAVNEAEGPDGTNSEKMFEYLDAIRDRAGLAGVKDSWANHSIDPDKPTRSKEGLRDIIQRERTIELMFEGKRYWDVRRWKKIAELNEQPRGWNAEGQTEEDFYKVINVHDRNIVFSVKDYFFPIKEDNLYVNEHLIQNYGWE